MADLLLHVRDHIALALSALAIALLLAVPAGALVARSPRWREPLLGAFNVARVVPSLAVLALMLPRLGRRRPPPEGWWTRSGKLAVLAPQQQTAAVVLGPVPGGLDGDEAMPMIGHGEHDRINVGLAH